MTSQLHMIDGIEYFETKTVTIKGKEYRELKSTNRMKPFVQYGEVVDREFIPINNKDIVYALRVKYAM